MLLVYFPIGVCGSGAYIKERKRYSQINLLIIDTATFQIKMLCTGLEQDINK